MVLENSSEDIHFHGRHKGKKIKRGEGRRDAAVPEHQMPISIIVSYQDDTYWVGPDACKIQIPAGHVLIFYGDNEHCGAASEHLNVRLHSYFDHPSVSAMYKYGPEHYKSIFYTKDPKKS